MCLASQAALRLGTGLVTVGVPRSLHEIFEIKLTEVMSFSLEETKENTLAPKAFFEITTLLNKIDVVALGCGASQHTSTQRLMIRLIEKLNKPLIVDADGINALSKDIKALKRRSTKQIILTPHLGEFSRLLKRSPDSIKRDRKKLAKEFALKYNLVLVLKGYRSIVTNGRDLFENTTGNPGMATAGSGDVLTGIVAGLVAQELDTFNAAKCGVYLHGLAGDVAAQHKTQSGMIASDIIEYLPQALKVQRKKGKS
jgi:NAD(P)H-hydrate epimerase